VLARPEVLIALLTTVMGASAMFALYTYVAPVLTTLASASDGFVTLALVLIGLGFTLGNWLGGRVADWSLDGATAIFLGLLSVVMLLAPLTMTTPLGAGITLFLWGAAAFAIVPPVQMRVMQAASDAPGLASSINIGAFNLGNAIGAALGGAAISTGLGYAAVPVLGGLTAAIALGLVWLGRQSNAPKSCAA
jgi:DHA1 family inner membrane transport protein